MLTRMSTELPIARLARWWGTRHERYARPEGFLRCGSSQCSNLVAPGEGIWLPQAREVACSSACAHDVQTDMLY